ncbi:hypothetical protein PU629_17015 [Pullulanibacillus sp. KACC 23026]|uniref:hypothetical protein n=1 Tax=Pullulanibacillus sp. KACC 23026 TaxID=3028315 RepID=UPI0023AF519B|nr:hypothetical protein [Pullulanibacillus sp. KACC 23026]WEG11820.1 hypothetical protein PU629_17015 [Pullulanibacillus sp. KACC 23026]
MSFFIYLLAFLFLSPFPSAWAAYRTEPIFIAYQTVRWILGIIYLYLVSYVFLIDLTAGGIISAFLPMFLIGVIIDGFVLRRWVVEAWRGIIGGAILLIGYGGFLCIYQTTLASDKYKMANAVRSNTVAAPININHIPVVPEAYARYKSEKLLGHIPNYAYYQLGDSTIQTINNQLYWVTPIEYTGYVAFTKAGVIPGYIKMSAEDENAEPSFIKAPMTIVPSAYFSQKLQRQIRRTFPHLILLGTSFEPDDQGRPFYVVSIGHYTHYRSVPQVDGILLFDPKTGLIKRYGIHQLPTFVDQVIPKSIAIERNKWFGKFRYGWLNSLIGRNDVHEPTQKDENNEVIAIFDQKLQMNWFTDHTINADSGSMVGYTLMDARTGKLTFYTKANGLINSRAALNSVNKMFKIQGFKGTSPVLYNLYGQYSWVVPVVDGNGVFRDLAIANAQNEKMVGYNESKHVAFDDYKTKLALSLADTAAPSQITDQTKLSGTVTHVFKAMDPNHLVTVEFMLSGSHHIFTVSSATDPYAPFIETGHRLTISYIETNQVRASALSITDSSINKLKAPPLRGIHERG